MPEAVEDPHEVTPGPRVVEHSLGMALRGFEVAELVGDVGERYEREHAGLCRCFARGKGLLEPVTPFAEVAAL